MLQIGEESPQPKRVSEMGFLACILEWSDGLLYSHHQHPHHLSCPWRAQSRREEAGSLTVAFPRITAWGAYLSPRSLSGRQSQETPIGSGKVRQEREGRQGRMCYQGHIHVDRLNIIPPGNSKKRPHFETSQSTWDSKFTFFHIPGSSRPRNWTHISSASCIGKWVLYH